MALLNFCFCMLIVIHVCCVSPRSIAPQLACQNGTAGEMSECPRNFKCVFPAGIDPTTGLFYGLCELNKLIVCQMDGECPSPAHCSAETKHCTV